MAIIYSRDQVLAMAPDPKAADTGRRTAAPRLWSGLGRHDHACWGLAQGSGKSPYQTVVDLRAPAFRCSCPSRKFPCKHALGLLLLLAENAADFPADPPPDWVSDWLQKRDQRADTPKADSAPPKTPDDTAAEPSPGQQQRRSARDEKVAGGMAELAVWLQDLMRQGLAELPSQGYGVWDRMASRLVDAQCGALARQVRMMGADAMGGRDWESRLLERLGRLRLLLAAWDQIDQLPPPLAADVCTAIGYTQSQKDLLATGEGLRDRWQVLARAVTEEDRLRVQRTWLWGESSGRCALVLDFAHGSMPLDTSLLPGLAIDAELVWFPSGWPQRALIRARHGESEPAEPRAWLPDCVAALQVYAQALAANPWLELVPVGIATARVLQDQDRWYLQDQRGEALPLAASGAPYWSLLAATAGQATAVVGSWDGRELTPLAVALHGRWQALEESI